MEDYFEPIRAALAPDATPDARAAGAAACRAILIVLEAQPDKPPVPALPDPVKVAALLRSLRAVPAEQLLDLAITKVRSMLPAEAEPVAAVKLAIPLIKVPAP